MTKRVMVMAGLLAGLAAGTAQADLLDIGRSQGGGLGVEVNLGGVKADVSLGGSTAAAANVSVGGSNGANVNATVGGGSVVGVNAGLGNAVGADVNVGAPGGLAGVGACVGNCAAGGGPGGSGAPVTPPVAGGPGTVAPAPGNTPPPVPRLLACAGSEGNTTAFNGYPVLDRNGRNLGVVHSATLGPNAGIHAVAIRTVNRGCATLRGGGLTLAGYSIRGAFDAAQTGLASR